MVRKKRIHKNNNKKQPQQCNSNNYSKKKKKEKKRKKEPTKAAVSLHLDSTRKDVGMGLGEEALENHHLLEL